MTNFRDLAKTPAERAAWVYGQPMEPCPKCGSYNMKPQMPIKTDIVVGDDVHKILGKWVRATKDGNTPLEGPCYYMCWDCGQKATAVDCTGRTSEECRRDAALNTEMKRLWNTQQKATP
jgi:hypothetical protein